MDKNCQSCGMPLTKPEDHGAADEGNPYCKYCTDAQGNLLPKEQVRQNMINFYNRTMGQTPEQAAVEVDKIMARMSAWQEKPQQVAPAVDNQTTALPSAEEVPEPSTPEPTVSEPQVEPAAEPSSEPE